ncbi:hypothetical protein FACS189440_06250 [Bacteroidia bacterium]|nr:hypothetical protein FACS189440_06250 [Bacteroidia bacterium]
MKCFTAHYLFFPPNERLKFHGIQLDEENRFQNIFPLVGEPARAVFANGIIFPVKQEICTQSLLQTLKEEAQSNPEASVFQLLENRHFPEIQPDEPVLVYVLDGIDLLAAKLGADNGRRHSYIQRLC